MGRGEYLELDSGTESKVQVSEHGPDLRDHVFYIERALRSMYAGDYEIALKYYSRALSQCLQLEEAWLGQCLALLDLGQFDEILVWAQRGQDHCPGSGPLFAVRAASLCRMGMREKAMGFLDSAFKNRNDHWLIWLCRAEVLTAEERTANSKYCLDKALGAGGVPRWWVWRRAGEMFLVHDQARLAHGCFARALELAPEFACNHLRMAQVCYLLGRREQARECLDHALRQCPDKIEALELKKKLERRSLTDRARALFTAPSRS